MITAIVLTVVSEVGLAVSVLAFVVSVLGGQWLVAMAAALLFVASVLMLFLAYYFVYTEGENAQRNKMRNKVVNSRVLTLKPGQSMAFRPVPGKDTYVTVRPEPGQWTTTRIEPVTTSTTDEDA